MTTLKKIPKTGSRSIKFYLLFQRDGKVNLNMTIKFLSPYRLFIYIYIYINKIKNKNLEYENRLCGSDRWF